MTTANELRLLVAQTEQAKQASEAKKRPGRLKTIFTKIDRLCRQAAARGSVRIDYEHNIYGDGDLVAEIAQTLRELGFTVETVINPGDSLWKLVIDWCAYETAATSSAT